MKNKTAAGVLALVAGYMGLHRFYLGQIGMGIGYIILLPILLSLGFWPVMFIGLIDGVAFLSMDQKKFDAKYNKAYAQDERQQNAPPQRRNERYQDKPARPSVPSRNRSAASNVSALLKAGKEKFKDYEYQGAIDDFEKALAEDPQHVAAHFNLACAYSLMENKDKSFYHLDRAVALGFDDVEAIKTRDHLAYLRIQPEFLTFQDNGYRLSKQLAAPRESLLDSDPRIAPQARPDLLEQLQKLAQLKEKGLLTEEEFRTQKEKLLR